MSSVVIDTCVLRLYNNPLDPVYAELFDWLNDTGVLYVNNKLLNEYVGTGNRNIDVLLMKLVKDGKNKRLVKIGKDKIESFLLDKHYNYTCNKEDQYHSKMVFLSPRKKLISQDKKIVNDVNNFKKVDGIQPEAVSHPVKEFYLDD